MEVNDQDKEESTKYLQMACNMVGLSIDYIHIDLILRLQAATKKKKGKFSIGDGVEIQHQWKQDWDKYFESQKEQAP